MIACQRFRKGSCFFSNRTMIAAIGPADRGKDVVLAKDARPPAEGEREIMARDYIGKLDAIVPRYWSARRRSAFL